MDELRPEDRHFEIVPEWLKPDFDWLQNETFELTQLWLQHEQLFNAGELRKELLGETAAGFFSVVGLSLSKNAIQDLWKLNQPAASRGTDALSLDRVMMLIAKHDPEFPKWDELKQTRTQIRQVVDGFDDIRDKYLSHFDRAALIGGKPAFDIPEVGSIGEAIRLVHHFWNLIRERYLNDHFVFDMSARVGDGDDLVEWLKRGLRYDELERADPGRMWDDLDQNRYAKA